MPQVVAGRYQIIAELGRGGMGRVLRARDLKLGREVAIKLLVRGAQDEQQRRRFEHEARAAGALNHPNVVAVHDIGEESGEPYIVSELLEGRTLRTVLAAGPLGPEEALRLATQVALGLAAAHAKGIVHRDLKPENLFLTTEGHLKILDFGIAKLLDTPAPMRTDTGAVMGTPGYMSPEQLRGEHADHRSDIFSFGAILHETLAGRMTFGRDTPVETGNAILHDEPPALPANVPTRLDHVVRRCLKKDPAERFQSARDLAFALEAVQLVQPLRPLNAGPARSKIVLAAGLIALLATTLAVFLVVRRATRPLPASIRQITFHAGVVGAARFAPDGTTVIYSLAQNGPPEVRMLRLGSSESSPLDLRDANLVALSPAGDLALLLHPRFTWFDWQLGTLARVALGGHAVRELLEGIEYADWGPDGELAVVR